MMKNKSLIRTQKALPGYKLPQTRHMLTFQKAFAEAFKVTKSYTLSRDVQDIVETALRREKRIP